MKASLVIAALVAAALGIAGGPGPASAHDGWRRPSVFPQPSDPWRHWGHPRVDNFHPKVHHGGHSRTIIVAPQAPAGAEFHQGAVIVTQPRRVWVPSHWAWNGFGWVWVPGHWAW